MQHPCCCRNHLPSLSLSFPICKMGIRQYLISLLMLFHRGFPGGASGKEPICQCRRQERHGFNCFVGKILWRRTWKPTPVFLPGESHGQKSLVGCSPRVLKELDRTEVTGACIVPQTGGILAMKQPCAGCWGFGLELGPAYPLEAWHQAQGTLNL